MKSCETVDGGFPDRLSRRPLMGLNHYVVQMSFEDEIQYVTWPGTVSPGNVTRTTSAGRNTRSLCDGDGRDDKYDSPHCYSGAGRPETGWS